MSTYHQSITDDAYLHYPKGTASASADTYLMAQGDGTTVFTSLPSYSLTVSDSLTLEYDVDQTISTEGDEANVLFTDTDTDSSGGTITIGADGTITFNTAGVYSVQVIGQVGRSATSGVADLYFAARVNSSQVGKTSKFTLSDSNDGFSLPLSSTVIYEAAEGDVMTFAMLASSLDSGDVGLYTETSSYTNWNDVSSAKVAVQALGIE